MLKKRAGKHPFERVPTPYQIFSWMAPLPEHTVDYIRAEDGMYENVAEIRRYRVDSFFHKLVGPDIKQKKYIF